MVFSQTRKIQSLKSERANLRAELEVMRLNLRHTEDINNQYMRLHNEIENDRGRLRYENRVMLTNGRGLMNSNNQLAAEKIRLEHELNLARQSAENSLSAAIQNLVANELTRQFAEHAVMRRSVQQSSIGTQVNGQIILRATRDNAQGMEASRDPPNMRSTGVSACLPLNGVIGFKKPSTDPTAEQAVEAPTTNAIVENNDQSISLNDGNNLAAECSCERCKNLKNEKKFIVLVASDDENDPHSYIIREQYENNQMIQSEFERRVTLVPTPDASDSGNETVDGDEQLVAKSKGKKFKQWFMKMFKRRDVDGEGN